MEDYFTDLEIEYNFYKQLDEHRVKINGKWFEYKIVSGFNEIEEYKKENTNTIFAILSIEGTHVFNTGLSMMGKKANREEVLANIEKVKQWQEIAIKYRN